MVERLLRLRTYIATIQDAHERITTNLTDKEWEILKHIKNILHPFKLAQEFLEDQKYVTISCIPLVISSIRQSLMIKGENAILPANFVLRNVLLRNLNARFGSGVNGTVIGEHLGVSPYNCPIGFSIHTLLGVALDPRTKNGIGVGPRDIQDIYKKLKEWAVQAVKNNQILNVNNPPVSVVILLLLLEGIAIKVYSQ